MKNFILFIALIIAFIQNLDAQDTAILHEMDTYMDALAGVPIQPVEEVEEEKGFYISTYDFYIIRDKIYVVQREEDGNVLVTYTFDDTNKKSFSINNRLVGEPLAEQKFKGFDEEVSEKKVYSFLSGEIDSIEFNYTQKGNSRSPFFSFQKNHRLYVYNLYKDDSGEIRQTTPTYRMVYGHRVSIIFFLGFGFYSIITLAYFFSRRVVDKREDEGKKWGKIKRLDKSEGHFVAVGLMVFLVLMELLLRLHQSGVLIAGWNAAIFVGVFILFIFPYIRFMLIWQEHGKVTFKRMLAKWGKYFG